MVLMKLFRLQSDSNDFSLFYQLQMVVFLPLLILTAKKVIPSLKVIKFLHSKINSNFYPVNNLFSHLRQATRPSMLMFPSCKRWENHNDPTWGSPKSTFQAGGVMYREEWHYLCLLAKKTEIWNSLPNDSGKWYMVCPSVPNFNSDSPAKTTVFISYYSEICFSPSES